jgi:hypothetical protein
VAKFALLGENQSRGREKLASPFVPRGPAREPAGEEKTRGDWI